MPNDPAQIKAIYTEIALVGRRLDLLHAFLSGELGGEGRPGNVHRVLETVAKDVAQIDRTLRGDAQIAGLLTRLDRLERDIEARVARERLIIGAVIAIAIKAVWDVIRLTGN